MTKPQTNNEISRGYFLTFNNTEEKDLLEFLKENSYPPDKTGIKEFILNSVYPEPEETGISPEMERLMRTGIGALGNMIKKKAGL